MTPAIPHRLIIAESGSVHDGSFGNACALIDIDQLRAVNDLGGRVDGSGAAKSAADSVVGESSVQSLLQDTSERASIVTSIMGARENARQVREQITSEMWEQLNRLFHAVRNSSAARWISIAPRALIASRRQSPPCRS